MGRISFLICSFLEELMPAMLCYWNLVSKVRGGRDCDDRKPISLSSHGSALGALSPRLPSCFCGNAHLGERERHCFAGVVFGRLKKKASEEVGVEKIIYLFGEDRDGDICSAERPSKVGKLFRPFLRLSFVFST